MSTKHTGSRRFSLVMNMPASARGYIRGAVMCRADERRAQRTFTGICIIEFITGDLSYDYRVVYSIMARIYYCFTADHMVNVCYIVSKSCLFTGYDDTLYKIVILQRI